MDISSYREEIKLKLTGGMLELEIDDPTIDKAINSVLREIQRYINTTSFITVPFQYCIDLNNLKDVKGKDIKISTVTGVYRTSPAGTNSNGLQAVDPMYASQWQLLSGVGNLRGFQSYMYNYMSWNTLQQIRNTNSTDLAFRFDKSSNKLYINVSIGLPQNITIEYIRRYDSVEDITSDYWIDFISRMSLALCKILVGRIRSRYTQSNALWTQDGTTLLEEGNTELTELRQQLKDNMNLLYPID